MSPMRRAYRRVRVWIPVALMMSTASAQIREPDARPYPELRAEQEAFLLTASVVTPAPTDGKRTWRATLVSGTRTHEASINTADGSDFTRQDHRFNVAAHELDKLLGLNMTVPTIERRVGGRPASVTWWLDDFAMSEVDRRRRALEPPDLERWSAQMHAVRVFDELISNTYRDPSPGLYLNSVWDNLLITKDWAIWLIDHTASFRVRTQLQDPESLARCPHPLLRKLRELDRNAFQRALGNYLTVQQLDALETRRALLVRHFDDAIARNGESAVLYDFARWH